MFKKGTKVFLKNDPNKELFTVKDYNSEGIVYLTPVHGGGYASTRDYLLVEWKPCCTFMRVGCMRGKKLVQDTYTATQEWQRMNELALRGKLDQREVYKAWRMLEKVQNELWKHLGEE